MFKSTLSVALVAALAGSAAVAPAAVAGTPSGIYTIFKYCPYTNPNVGNCFLSVTDSGSLSMGNTTLPIVPSIVLQGGVTDLGPSVVYDAVGAPTLSSPPAKVPGGLLGIANPAPDWPFPLWVAFWNIVNSVNDVTATMELVQPVQTNFGNALFPPTDGSDGTAVRLAVRARLGNPFLGNTCFVGSAASPIVLKLQTGTTNPPPPNQPISGNTGSAEFIWSDEANGIGYLQNSGNIFVDNSFAVPGASGCGNIALGLPIVTQVLDFLVSGAVNLKTGLPSAAGKNTAIMKGNASIVGASFVLASEQ